ncbi:cupin domain-containing protein [Longimicrobium sp.]|uniref:cupin domain-containing protein n=1 Tax=Longimicrobium sp. TaxID=2029185 RepID=UPI002C3EE9DC|nr:cupin domain-containing protein [Longimicrobium sp.]HSU13696.1 cupin domain-containing protein [Longimicrobium sp.]
MSTSAMPPGTIHIRNFLGEIRVRSEQTGGGLTVVEHTLPPGYIAMPLHTHQREAETTYVLEGTLWVQLGKRVTKLGPGQSIAKPAGVPHTYWNEGTRPARFLDMLTPGGLEPWYEEVATVIPARGEVEVGKVLEISRRYGLEFDMESLLDIMSRHQVVLA